jgi:hypothetical protein
VNRQLREHWNRVAAMGCLVTGSTWQVTLHHAHGGSLVDRGFTRTFGRKTSDWLVIPVTRILHVGPGGIDGPPPRPTVEEWEAKYRKQAEMLDEICMRIGYDVWALARGEERGMVPRAA